MSSRNLVMGLSLTAAFVGAAGAVMGNSSGANWGAALFGDGGASIMSTITTIGGLIAGGAVGAAAFIGVMAIGIGIVATALIIRQMLKM